MSVFLRCISDRSCTISPASIGFLVTTPNRQGSIARYKGLNIYNHIHRVSRKYYSIKEVSNLKRMGELLVYPSNPFYWFKKIFQCFWIWRKTHMHKSGRTYLSNQETQCNTKWKIHWQTFQKILFQNLNLISCISSKGDPVKTTKMKYQQNQEEAQKKMKLFSK